MATKDELRMANSQTLSQVAIGLLAALGAFVAFALDGRALSVRFVLSLSISALLLVSSIVLGGRGIAKIEDPKNLFNLQAWACLLGFIAIGGALCLVGPPPNDDMVDAISSLSARLGGIEQRIQQLETAPAFTEALQPVVPSCRSDSLAATATEPANQPGTSPAPPTP